MSTSTVVSHSVALPAAVPSVVRIGSASGDARLRMPWRNAIAVGRAYELLRADVQAHVQFVQQNIGYGYCRFHGIFHDDMDVVRRLSDGSLAFQWRQVDQILDMLLSAGLRPFVELHSMPSALASGIQTMFHWACNVTPPRSLTEWSLLIREFAIHTIGRYGVEEVRHWYFEVWNEPDLPAFWTGTQAEYFNLYDATARTLKEIDSRLRVGGPATSKAVWIKDFIQHCDCESVPLDFVSTHSYPQDEYVIYPDRQGSPHQPGHYFADTVRSVQEQVRSSTMPDLEIHWTEWNAISAASTAQVDWIGNPTVDSLYAASFIVHNALQLDDAADTLCYWTVSDVFEEAGMPQAPFSSTYGLLTVHGIPKASFNAFWLLSRLRGRPLSIKVAGTPSGCGCYATQEYDEINVLLWNHADLTEPRRDAWSGVVQFPQTKSDLVLTMAHLREGAGSPWQAWTAMGSPQNLSCAEEAMLRAHAQMAWTTCTLRDAEQRLDFILEPNEVLYVSARPAGQNALRKGGNAPGVATWNAGMGQRSRGRGRSEMEHP